MNLDLGLTMLDSLFASMQIDARWSVRESRSFTWWGHRLAQRVWAEPVRASHGFEVVKLGAETALLRDVPPTRRTAERLAVLNHHASMSAMVWDEDSGHVRLRCSASVHAETRETVAVLFGAAVTLQAADAHIKVQGMAELLGGEPDFSAHPASGERPTPDEMLSVIELLYAPQGRFVPPYTKDAFVKAAAMKPAPWLEAKAEGVGLRGLLGAPGETSPTGLFFARGDQYHPQLGSGLLTLLNIPTELSTDGALALVHELNLAEAHVWESPYFFGAWCLGQKPYPGITFAAFYPATICRAGLVEAVAIQAAARALWVRRELDDGLREVEAFADAIRTGADYTSPPSALRLAMGRSVGWDGAAQLEELLEEPRDPQRPSAQAPSPSVQCWSCRAPLVVTPETRGKKVKCPRCGTKQALPR